MGMDHPAMQAQIGTGRPKGSKNKKITAAKITQQVRELAASQGAPQAIYEFLMSYLSNPKARDSERIKAAKFLLDKFIVDANVDTLVDSRVEMTPEEALSILNGDSNESS